jgi:nitrile hydratase
VNGVHDMGGTHGHGRVVVEKNEPVFHEPWEGRVRGMVSGLLRAGLFNLDEFRHAQERLPPDEYLRSSYYARWLAALELLLREKGPAHERKGLPETRAEARFKPGDRVLTRNINPPGHTRLPRYARAKKGIVESVRGPYLLPDTNAHERSRDWEPVFTVIFSARELWGEHAERRQSVSIDLWQSYLEAET